MSTESSWILRLFRVAHRLLCQGQCFQFWRPSLQWLTTYFILASTMVRLKNIYPLLAGPARICWLVTTVGMGWQVGQQTGSPVYLLPVCTCYRSTRKMARPCPLGGLFFRAGFRFRWDECLRGHTPRKRWLCKCLVEVFYTVRNASVGVCLHCVYSCPRRRGECAVQGKGKGVSSPVAFTASLNYELSWIKSANRGMFFFITFECSRPFF